MQRQKLFIDPSSFVTNRRGVLKGTAALIGSMLIEPVSFASYLAEEYEWKTMVKDLIQNVIASRDQALEMCELVDNAALQSRGTSSWSYQSFSSDSFHDKFCASFIFPRLILSPSLTRYGSCFELEKFPFYDVNHPCLRTKDLNESEIRRIINRKEKDRFDCVPAPCNLRQPMNRELESEFTKTAVRYDREPSDYKVISIRPYRVKRNGDDMNQVRGFTVTPV
jgi:hypothetical protein